MAPRREPSVVPRRQEAVPRRRPAPPRIRVQTAPRRRVRPSLGLPVRGLAHAVIPKQTWIDRIVRGRAWIPVFGALLVAIVGMRVEVLKLSSRVGTQIEQSAALQSSNAALRSTVSELSGNERIEALAERLGMVMPGPMDIHFVPGADGSHLRAAIRAIRGPDPTVFLTGLADERQADLNSMATAADTSAVGALAGTVPGYSQTSLGSASSSPLVAAFDSSSLATSSVAANSTGSLSTQGTAAAGSNTTATTTPGSGSGSAGSSTAGSAATAGGTGAGAGAGAGAGSATGTAGSGSSGDTAVSTPTTVTPTQGSAGTTAATSSSAGPTSSAGTQSSSPTESSSTGTYAGGTSGSTTGGTSLNG